MLAGVLDALEALPAEAAAVRGRVRVLHLVLPVRGAGAEPAMKTKEIQCINSLLMLFHYHFSEEGKGI